MHRYTSSLLFARLMSLIEFDAQVRHTAEADPNRDLTLTYMLVDVDADGISKPYTKGFQIVRSRRTLEFGKCPSIVTMMRVSKQIRSWINRYRSW